MVIERIISVANRGFAIGVPEMRAIQGQITADGHKSYANELPSEDSIRSFRSRNRTLTYRRPEHKDIVKLRARNVEHVLTLKEELEIIAA